MKAMRYLILSIIVIFIVFSGCKQDASEVKSASNEYAKVTSLTYKSEDQVLISAHRGGKEEQGYPENCLETMKYLYSKGIRMFEVDIRTTSDKRLVLMHDKSLERTTNGRDLISKISYVELGKLFLKDHNHNVTKYRIPLLKEVFHWATQNDVVIQLDLKRIDYSLLEKEMEGYDLLDKVVMITYSKRQTTLLHQRFPDYMLSVSMRNHKEFEQALNLGIPTSRMLAFTGTRLSDKGLYDDIHDQGIKVILGTLGNIDRKVAKRGDKLYVDYVRMGVDILATDRPLEARSATLSIKTN